MSLCSIILFSTILSCCCRYADFVNESLVDMTNKDKILGSLKLSIPQLFHRVPIFHVWSLIKNGHFFMGQTVFMYQGRLRYLEAGPPRMVFHTRLSLISTFVQNFSSALDLRSPDSFLPD